MRNAIHPLDMRSIAIPSQLMYSWISDPTKARSLERFFNGIDIFSVDIFVWPLNTGSHWVLCIACVKSFCVTILDPMDPYNSERIRSSESKKVLKALNCMCASQARIAGKQNQWTLSGCSTIARNLNLPVQHESNTTDCGVLVCIYVWCILTGKEYPFSSQERKNSYSRRMSYFRKLIASRILLKV